MNKLIKYSMLCLGAVLCTTTLTSCPGARAATKIGLKVTTRATTKIGSKVTKTTTRATGTSRSSGHSPLRFVDEAYKFYPGNQNNNDNNRFNSNRSYNYGGGRSYGGYRY